MDNLTTLSSGIFFQRRLSVDSFSGMFRMLQFLCREVLERVNPCSGYERHTWSLDPFVTTLGERPVCGDVHILRLPSC